MTDFFANQWVNMVSILIGVVGIVLAIIFFKKGKQVKEIAFHSRTIPLIGKGLKSIEKLSFLYENKPIDFLSVSEFLLWNYGNLTVKESDLASTTPLEIFCDTGRILNFSVLYSSSESNLFKLSIQNEKNIAVHFEYAEPMEGIILRVYHTGDFLTLNGKIVGGYIRFRNLPVPAEDRSKILRDSFFMFLGSLGLIAEYFFGKIKLTLLLFFGLSILIFALWNVRLRKVHELFKNYPGFKQ